MNSAMSLFDPITSPVTLKYRSCFSESLKIEKIHFSLDLFLNSGCIVQADIKIRNQQLTEMISIRQLMSRINVT
jgi:hypothetical protein